MCFFQCTAGCTPITTVWGINQNHADTKKPAKNAGFFGVQLLAGICGNMLEQGSGAGEGNRTLIGRKQHQTV